MNKKHYTPPEITDLGDVVAETKGVWGRCWEVWGGITCNDPDEPIPPAKET